MDIYFHLLAAPLLLLPARSLARLLVALVPLHSGPMQELRAFGQHQAIALELERAHVHSQWAEAKKNQEIECWTGTDEARRR